MGTRDVCQMPPAAVRNGRASQGPYRAGIVEWSCGYLARGVSIREKIRYIEKPGVLGGRHVAKRR